MAENLPTLEEWRQLYEAAICIKELAPWEWMAEDDLFGVQSPETGESGFISVMGALGQHFSIAVYQGDRGLYGFLDMLRTAGEGPAEQVLEVPQLQLSFEDRQLLRDQDRAVLKQLGLKFRGKNAWPLFRSYRPGYYPWFIESAEARFLLVALEQTIEVAPRFKQKPSLLRPSVGRSWFARVPQQQEGGLVWEDHIMEVLPPKPPPIPVKIDNQAIEAVKRLPKGSLVFEVDLFLTPTPIQEKKELRPILPYLLLMADKHSGFIFGNEMLVADPSYEAMWGRTPMAVIKLLAQARQLPREIRVRSQALLDLLQPLLEQVGVPLKLSPRLRSIDEARDAMFSFFAR